MNDPRSPAEEMSRSQAEESLRVVAVDTKSKISRNDLKTKAVQLNNTVLNKIAGLLGFYKEQWEYYVEFCKRNGHEARHIRSVREMYDIEYALNNNLEKLPKVALDRLTLAIEYNLEIIKKLVQLKALYLKRKVTYDHKPELKKSSEFQLYRDIYGLLNTVLNGFVQLNYIIRTFDVFRKFTLFFAEASYNREELDAFLASVVNAVNPVFDVEAEALTFQKCRIIAQMNNRFLSRLAYLQSCQRYKSYKELIEFLEVRSSVMFYNKVITKYPGQTLKQIQENTAISALKEDFIKRKLAFFYRHMEFILQKLAQINELDSKYSKLQEEFAKKSNAFMTEVEQDKELRMLHRKQGKLFHSFRQVYDAATESTKIAERSLQELFEDMLKAYAMLLLRDIRPSSKLELVLRYLKTIEQKVPKHERINKEDLAILKNVMNERNVPLLKIYYKALNELARGEINESAIVKPINDILKEKKPDREIKSPSGVAYLQLSRVITPEDILNIIHILKYLPKDRPRLSSPLGFFFINLANLFMKNLKNDINYPPDIRPVGTRETYVAALIEQKLVKLYFAALSQPIEGATPLDLLAEELKKENESLETLQKQSKIKAFHLLNNLVTFWDTETNKAIQTFLTSDSEEKKYSVKSVFPRISKSELNDMVKTISLDQLKELNKHCEILEAVYSGIFKNGEYPTFKEELLLLYIIGEKLYSLRDDERAKFTQLYERVELHKSSSENEYQNLA